jgi:very-short-patch-repair endonuclease
MAEETKAFARTLRKNTTDAERSLWAALREFKQTGLHFRKQAPIGPYIADFVCHRAKLVVELDGDQHGADHTVAYDKARTAFLNSRGYRVIRFANWEVLREKQRVVDAIYDAAKSPHPASR